MKIILYANQKGGVSKSITSYNFGFYLAQKQHKRVLFIDADPQHNSSDSLRTCTTTLTAAQFYSDKPIQFPATENNLVLARGEDELKKVELMPDEIVVKQLAARLKEAEAAGFEYVVADTPGANAKVVGGFLLSATHVIVPTSIDSYSLNVAITMLQRIVSVQQHFNKSLVNLGLLPSLLKPGAVNQRRELEGLMRDYSKYVIRAAISDRMAYKEAADEGVAVWDYTRRQKRDELGKPVFDDRERPVMERVSNEAAAKEMLAAFDLIFSKVNA